MKEKNINISSLKYDFKNLRHTIEIIQTEVQWSKYHFKIFLKQEAGNNTEKE